MDQERDEPTAAQRLASLISGNGSASFVGASVQRSHRFPMHIFIQIENMARMGGMSVSMVINQLLEAGLEATRDCLSPEAAEEMTLVSEEQLQRATVPYLEEKKPATKLRKVKTDPQD